MHNVYNFMDTPTDFCDLLEEDNKVNKVGQRQRLRLLTCSLYVFRHFHVILLILLIYTHKYTHSRRSRHIIKKESPIYRPAGWSKIGQTPVSYSDR
jgi:hypothetical protein